MTRRDILKGLAAFPVCGRAFASAKQGEEGIIVRMQARCSDVLHLRGDVVAAQSSVPIGREHFVSDLACYLGIERASAAALLSRYGLPAPGEACGPGEHYPDRPRRVIRNADGSVVSAPMDLYAEIIEVRAEEFAGLVRDAVIRELGPGRARAIPVLLGGSAIRGIDRMMERGALWKAG